MRNLTIDFTVVYINKYSARVHFISTLKSLNPLYKLPSVIIFF